MIKEQEKNEMKTINNDNNEENIIESSFEYLDGEEEDEDDLLKSESDTNKSSNKNATKDNLALIDEIITSDKNKNINDNIKNNINNNNKNTDESSTKNIPIVPNINKSYSDVIDLNKSNITDKTDKIIPEKKSSNNKVSKGEEEEEEEEEEGEEDEENEEIEDNINPYDLYMDSKIKFSDYLNKLKEGEYIYGKETKIYYILLKKSFRKNVFMFIKDQPDEKNKRDKLIKVINDILIDNNNSKEVNKAIKKKFFTFIQKKVEKEEIILIEKKNLNKYTINRKVQIYYINYLKMKQSFYLQININWKLKDFLKYIIKLYHIPDIKDNANLTIFLKNKQYSGKDITKNEENIFSPKCFDYEKDYILIIEHENFEIISNIDSGSSIDKYNFKGKQKPHMLFSSHYNLCIESILVSNQITCLECEVYSFRDEYNFNLECNVGKYNYDKAKDALSSFNWKNKCNYITTIKSLKTSDYKNNDDVLSFTIWPKFMLYHNKTYIFLVSTPIKKINVFDLGSLDQGLFIISGDNKSIINGIICKKISDFCKDI